LTDPAGQVVWAADYGAFGRARPATAAIDQPLRLPGHYHDPETRLDATRHRYYAPDLGRYVSPRPPGPDVEPNDYRYVGDAPVTRRVPLGAGAGRPPAHGGSDTLPTPPPASPRRVPPAAIAAALAFRLNEAATEALLRPPGTPADPTLAANAEALANLP